MRKLLCKLGFHKTAIVSLEMDYRIVCIHCNKQWHEDGTVLWKGGEYEL